MPIMQLHLPEGVCNDAAVAKLLVEASEFYCDIFYPQVTPRPIERLRAFVVNSPSNQWATGGKLVSEGGALAPYFTVLALTGRPPEQLAQLMDGLTSMIVTHLGCERKAVRGQVIEIEPQNWFIGGVPAAQARANEAAQRSQGFGKDEK